MPQQRPLLEIQNLSVGFDTNRGTIRPVAEVSLSVYPGQTVALVGESGCGKSVTALSILRLIPSPPGRILGGRINFEDRNLLDLSERQMRSVRGKDIAMIFQEPMTSLNPVYTIGDQIVEAVTLHQGVSTKQAYDIAEESLNDVGISDAHRRLQEYPHQMSGGMRQRVMIAMALSCKPKLLIADEPTTALDVTIQAQILELLRKLQRERGMSILLITHDLGVVAENADVVGVMYASRVVEFATVEDLFDHPKHPYTEGLFKSVPKLGSQVDRLETIPGMVPNPIRFPAGCKFHPRCHRTRACAAAVESGQAAFPPGTMIPAETAIATDSEGERFSVLKKCAADEPSLGEVQPSHWAACHVTENFERSPRSLPQLDHRREVVPAIVEDGAITV
ncbi:MAG TPA: ABC transporter ATP-binding protein [Tepidisphaeraceae bacterium]|jgi:peptide/nickel transport system ATP-binding protein/oligopeptide transport system ATP-binding protein|nr:ABC transporter ATP-binding protein [Tepidisphaeraceae bacterium]